MSNIDAFRTSVSGMTAQSTKLNAISNNIANSSTVGFKRTDTQFESLVLGGQQSGASALAGTRAVTRVEVSRAGAVQATSSATDIAIGGTGYLVVKDSNSPSGLHLATRAGAFRPDSEGNLVNTAGYFLQGVPVDSTGAPLGGGGNTLESLQTVNINAVGIATAPTTRISYWANLPASETAAGATGDAITSSVDYYDALGAAQRLNLSFTPNVATPPATATNSWRLTVSDTASAGNPLGSLDMAFNATGPEAGLLQGVTGQNYDPATGILTLPAGNGSQPIALNIGMPGSSSGLTQMQGEFTEMRIDKDGSAYGTLQGVTVEQDGLVMASFSNGQSRPIYQLKLAAMPNPDGMMAVRGDAFAFSAAAGVVRLVDPGEGSVGATIGNALEGSNVDMSTELTNLIETQRAYSSNATVVRTADQMLQEVNDLKR